VLFLAWLLFSGTAFVIFLKGFLFFEMRRFRFVDVAAVVYLGGAAAVDGGV